MSAVTIATAGETATIAYSGPDMPAVPDGYTRVFADHFDYNLPIGSLAPADILADRTLRPGSMWHTALGKQARFTRDNSWNTGERGKYWTTRTTWFGDSCLNIKHHAAVINGATEYLGGQVRWMPPNRREGNVVHPTGRITGGRVRCRMRITDVIGEGYGGLATMLIGAPQQPDQPDHWPRLGELDPDERTFKAGAMHGGYFHEASEQYPAGSKGTVRSINPPAGVRHYLTDWHVLDCEWIPAGPPVGGGWGRGGPAPGPTTGGAPGTPGRVTVRVDDVVYATFTTGVPWDALPVTTQTGKNVDGPIDPTWTSTLQLDWLTIDQLT